MNHRYRPALRAGAAGFLCAAALCMRITVPDQLIAEEQYGLQFTDMGTDTVPNPVPKLLINMAKIWQILPENSWAWGAAALALGFLFYHILKAKGPHRLDLGAAVLGMAFGALQVFSLSLQELGSWEFILAGKFQCALALVCMLGYALLFYMGALALGLAADSRRALGGAPASGRLAALWDARTHAFASALILLGWLPWLLAYLPGSISWDSAFQLEQAYGVMENTTHAPALSTWLQGGCLGLGRLLGADNIGIFLYMALQSVFCAWVYGAMAAFAKKLGCRRGVQLGVTAFFALVPAWGAYAQVLIKDTLFTGAFALFMLLTADLLVFRTAWQNAPKRLIAYAAAALLTCLLRHNGVYAVLPGMLLAALAVCRGRLRRGVLAAAAGAMGCLLAFNWAVTNVFGIPKENAKEMLSIPFQQTARYVTYYGDEVTEEERAAIDAVLDYDAIPTHYYTYLSDYIKNAYKDPGPEAMAEYWRVWLQMLLKHPDCYLQATQANSYGYYTVLDTGVWKLKEQYFCYLPTEWLADGGFDVSYVFTDSVPRYALYDWALTFDRLPLLGLLTDCGFSTWLAVGATLVLLHRRRRAAALALPLFMIFLTCVASPVNDMLRYYLPILASMPLYLCLVLSAKQTARED